MKLKQAEDSLKMESENQSEMTYRLVVMVVIVIIMALIKTMFMTAG